MTEQGFAKVRAEELLKETQLSYADVVGDLRKVFLSGKTKDLEWRKAQLKQLYKLGRENFNAISVAVQKDLGGGAGRGAVDVMSILSCLEVLANLDEWAKPKEVKIPNFTGNAKAYILNCPKGVCLCIGPWNFSFSLVIRPVIDMIAAGNCVLIKPSEVSVHTSKIIAELIPKYMDTEAIKVVQGGVPETTALLRERFDHIMYTGNGSVGRVIMTAAAKHLTPVTLELGGKNPTYVDKTADLKLVANRVWTGKILNAGQICVAPDYLLVHKDVVAELKANILEEIKKYDNLLAAKMINERHVERVEKLLKGSTGKVLSGDKNSIKTPVFLENPSLTDELMKEEIFGPVLPIKEVSGVDEAIDVVNQVCDTPLAVYVFADVETEEGRKVVDEFIDRTRSGGVCVNQIMEQIDVPGLHLGGVGQSGMGRYHGQAGFLEFSHQRSVYEKDSIVDKTSPFVFTDESAKFMRQAFESAGNGLIN